MYAMMTPFWSSKAGGLHVTKTALGPRTFRVKFSGGAVGTVAIKNNDKEKENMCAL